MTSRIFIDLAHYMSGNGDTGVAYCLGSNAAPDLR
jgi:hypothetical protein